MVIGFLFLIRNIIFSSSQTYIKKKRIKVSNKLAEKPMTQTVNSNFTFQATHSTIRAQCQAKTLTLLFREYLIEEVTLQFNFI